MEIPQLKGYESYRFVEGLLAFYFCLRIWNPLLFQEGALVHNFYNSCLITAVNKPVATYQVELFLSFRGKQESLTTSSKLPHKKLMTDNQGRLEKVKHVKTKELLN